VSNLAVFLKCVGKNQDVIEIYGDNTFRALGMVPGDSTEVLQRCGEYTYEQEELRGRVGKERGGKKTDRCSITTPPPLMVMNGKNEYEVEGFLKVT
jgi:hypothetical protein